MSRLKFEYIWLDGNQPLPHIRCQTTVRNADPYRITARIIETVREAHEEKVE